MTWSPTHGFHKKRNSADKWRSLVSEVKENKDEDTILLQLKANVHKQRELDFEQAGDGILKYKAKWIDYKRGSRRKLIDPDLPFIQVSERCTAI